MKTLKKIIWIYLACCLELAFARPHKEEIKKVNKFDMHKELNNSAVLKAMGNELKRSVDSLRIGGIAPYFTSYLLWDLHSYQLQSSLGVTENAGYDNQKILDVDLRIGNYQLDNSNFQGGYVFGPRLRAPLPEGNDTNLIRQALWAMTDARYKVALEQYAQKKAYISGHNGYDTLLDFSPQKPQQNYYSEEPTVLDTASIRKLSDALSGHLRKTPWLAESRVAYQYYYTTFYYVDSEGSRYIFRTREHTFLVSLLVQASDGAPIWDYLRISSRNPHDTETDIDLSKPFSEKVLSQLKVRVDSLVKRLDKLRQSPPMINYRGPVLFAGAAAGELLQNVLLTPQTTLREPVSNYAEQNFLLNLWGRKYLPNDIDVTDNPLRESYAGKMLYGYYPFDHQAQAPQAITLVKNGKIVDFFRGRIPFEKSKPASEGFSNGHWRYNGGFPGVTELSSKQKKSEQGLIAKLKTLSTEEGIEYALILSKPIDEDALRLLRHPLANSFRNSGNGDGHSSFNMSIPCEIDSLNFKTGMRIPVRGLSFSAVDSKSLRQIVGVGDKPHVYEPQAASTILCPSLLFSLLDLKGNQKTQAHLPYLP